MALLCAMPPAWPSRGPPSLALPTTSPPVLRLPALRAACCPLLDAALQGAGRPLPLLPVLLCRISFNRLEGGFPVALASYPNLNILSLNNNQLRQAAQTDAALGP